MRAKRKKYRVLIPDGENFYLQKILYCLATTDSVELYVVSSKKYTPTRFSRYIFKFCYLPKPEDDRDWVNRICQLCDTYQIEVLMPMYEDRIRTLTVFFDLLPERCKPLVPSSVTLFDTANHKGLLARHMHEYDIPGPRSQQIENLNQLDKKILELQFPILVKPPTNTGGGVGILKFEDREGLSAFLSSNELQFPLLFQEFISGFDSGCNVLCKNGEILAYTIQKGFLYSNLPYSPQTGLVTIHQEEILDIARSLMKSLNWTGLANIDLLYDRGSNKYLVLEINPRFWNTVVGSALAGVNFPLLYIRAAMGEKFELPEYKETTFINLKGLASMLKRDPRTIFKRRLIWEQTPFKFALRDPVPTVYHYIWRTKNIIMGRERH